MKFDIQKIIQEELGAMARENLYQMFEDDSVYPGMSPTWPNIQQEKLVSNYNKFFGDIEQKLSPVLGKLSPDDMAKASVYFFDQAGAPKEWTDKLIQMVHKLVGSNNELQEIETDQKYWTIGIYDFGKWNTNGKPIMAPTKESAMEIALKIWGKQFSKDDIMVVQIDNPNKQGMKETEIKQEFPATYSKQSVGQLDDENWMGSSSWSKPTTFYETLNKIIQEEVKNVLNKKVG